jgi:phospholipase/lecithinase/hemolysin
MSYNSNLVANYSIRNNTKPPGVQQQIDQYINSTINTTIDFDLTLYVIWVGINSYYFTQTWTLLQTVQSIINCLNVLILVGAKNSVVINEPSYDRFPQFRNKSTTNTTKDLYIHYNEILTGKINETYFVSNTRVFNNETHLDMFRWAYLFGKTSEFTNCSRSSNFSI